MEGLKELLIKEKKHLERIVDKVRLDLKSAPDGHLRVSRDKNKIRYYHCLDDAKEIYITKANDELPKKLAQKKYNQTVLKKAEIRLRQIKTIARDYEDGEIEKIYSKMNKERQQLVTPVETTWEQMLTKWREETYQGKEFYEGTPIIMTEKGERVRSKSVNDTVDVLVITFYD